MKEFIRYLTYDAKHGKEKITDRMLTVKIGFSVLMILFCVAVMSLSAFAFFTHNMTTQVNSIRSASYNLEIIAQEGLTPDETGAYLLDNSGGTEEKIFAFVLKKSANSTASVGYCELMIETDTPNPGAQDGLYHYYTNPIGTFLKEGTEQTVETRTAYIRVAPMRSAKVVFSAEWGSTAEEPLEDTKYAWPGYSDLTAEEQAVINGTAGGEEPGTEGQSAEGSDPQDDTAAETPAETPTDTSVDSPAETPADSSADAPAEETPSDTTEIGETDPLAE